LTQADDGRAKQARLSRMTEQGMDVFHSYSLLWDEPNPHKDSDGCQERIRSVF
jgi:hypothetical protein